MARPERYQLPLLVEFGGRRAEETRHYRAALAELAQAEGAGSRFIRQVVEPMFIRSPVEAASYLMGRIYTPFDQFQQEELWTLLLNTKNRVTKQAIQVASVLGITILDHIVVGDAAWVSMKEQALAFR